MMFIPVVLLVDERVSVLESVANKKQRLMMDGLMWHSIVAVAVGSALGALLRWFFSMKLNGLFPAIPLGTVSANLIGGYCIGLAIAYFSQAVNIAPEWRLLIVTGFCGGLTTFSTFSVELLSLLQQGRMALGFMMLAIHVSGSLIMTFVGMISWQWFEFR